jgi:hypothetical protein
VQEVKSTGDRPVNDRESPWMAFLTGTWRARWASSWVHAGRYDVVVPLPFS